MLGRHGVPLHHLTLEITGPSILAKGTHRLPKRCAGSATRGWRALDDFGTGYAFLTHLLTMLVDYLKIDKTFTDQLLQSSASRAILEGVLHIARELQMAVIAEGVETELQAERLRGIGCAYGQGHLFSPAVDAERATQSSAIAGLAGGAR